MNAIIQHNFTSGLGDCIVAIYEYLDTAEILYNKGFKIKLILNLNRNSYINDEDFFEIFNKNEFKYFNEIEFTKTPINEIISDGLTRVYTLSSPPPGSHWWDLFVSNPNYFNMDYVKIYPYQLNVIPVKRQIFNKKIIEEYENLKINSFLLENFVSIYFRTFDLQDGDFLYETYKDNILNIIKSNDTVFICSNSFKFKNTINKFYFKNVKIYTIPEEENYGNHFYGNKKMFNNEILLERTKFAIFDMMSLSKSSIIYHFTEWGRTSNFLFLSKINNVNIKIIT